MFASLEGCTLLDCCMIDGSEEQGLKERCKTCGMKATFSVLPTGRRSYKEKITKNKGTGALESCHLLSSSCYSSSPTEFLHADCKNNQRNEDALPVSFT